MGGAGGIGFYRSPTNRKVTRNFVFHGSGKNLENHLRVLCKDRIITGSGKILADRGLWISRDNFDTGPWECVYMDQQRSRRNCEGAWSFLAPNAGRVLGRKWEAGRLPPGPLVRQEACCPNFSLQDLRTSHLLSCRIVSNNKAVAWIHQQGKMITQIRKPRSQRKEITD